jgi:hypothetical protein
MAWRAAQAHHNGYHTIGVLLYNHSDVDFQVAPGDRIAQLCIERYSHPFTVEGGGTERGAGWGSSGVALIPEGLTMITSPCRGCRAPGPGGRAAIARGTISSWWAQIDPGAGGWTPAPSRAWAQGTVPGHGAMLDVHATCWWTSACPAPPRRCWPRSSSVSSGGGHHRHDLSDLQELDDAAPRANLGALVAPGFAIGALLLMRFAAGRSASACRDHQSTTTRRPMPLGHRDQTAELMADAGRFR